MLEALLNNPHELYLFMINNNSNFKEFVKNNEGKTIEDIILEYDLNFITIENHDV